MWTFNKLRAARAIVAGIIAALALIKPTPSHAITQYVQVCSLYGSGFFYIPGTDTCTNTNQIVTNQFAIARASTLSSTSTAMAASLVNPFLPDDTNYAISVHWAGFDGQNAVGFVGLMRLKGNLTISAGVSLGLDRGSLLSISDRTQTQFGTSVPSQSWSDVRALGRVGLEYAW